jgi:predicted metal-dependent hydrolase
MLVINHPTVGTVTLKKNARAKRIILKVKPQKGIWVTLPQRASYDAGKKMVEQHIEWILSQQAKYADQACFFQIGTILHLRDKTLEICAASDSKSSIHLGHNYFQFYIPSEWQLDVDKQTYIRDNIIEILRAEAKDYLIPRTRTLAAQKNIVINKVTIKNMRTRWGSCSSKSNINLSLFLMLLSDELIDYVIWHELAHIKHKNHSAAFWGHLEHLLPNSKVWDKQMRSIQIPF